MRKPVWSFRQSETQTSLLICRLARTFEFCMEQGILFFPDNKGPHQISMQQRFSHVAAHIVYKEKN